MGLPLGVVPPGPCDVVAERGAVIIAHREPAA
jgi:hypothetical protein